MNQARDKVRRAESPLPYRELTKRRSRPSRLTLPIESESAPPVVRKKKQSRPSITVSSVEQLLAIRPSLSESKVSAFPRLLGSSGLPGTPSRAGSRRWRGACRRFNSGRIIGFAVEELRWTRFAPSPATKSGKCGFSPRSKLGLVSGHRRASRSRATKPSKHTRRLARRCQPDRLGESSLIVTEGPSPSLPSPKSGVNLTAIPGECRGACQAS